MPLIKVWCLPHDQSEEDYRRVHRAIVDALVLATEQSLRSERDMTVVFPKDLMAYGLGTDIFIEIVGLVDEEAPKGINFSVLVKRERSSDLCHRAAEKAGLAVGKLYPNARVECLVYLPVPQEHGFWRSNEPRPRSVLGALSE